MFEFHPSVLVCPCVTDYLTPVRSSIGLSQSSAAATTTGAHTGSATAFGSAAGQASSSVLASVMMKDVLSAEIYWALNTAEKHYSFKSSEQTGKLFQAMFPDSAIAKKFACGDRKCNYLTT